MISFFYLVEDIDSSQTLDEKKPLEDLCNLKLVRTMKSHKEYLLNFLLFITSYLLNLFGARDRLRID